MTRQLTDRNNLGHFTAKHGRPGYHDVHILTCRGALGVIRCTYNDLVTLTHTQRAPFAQRTAHLAISHLPSFPLGFPRASAPPAAFPPPGPGPPRSPEAARLGFAGSLVPGAPCWALPRRRRRAAAAAADDDDGGAAAVAAAALLLAAWRCWRVRGLRIAVILAGGYLLAGLPLQLPGVVEGAPS